MKNIKKSLILTAITLFLTAVFAAPSVVKAASMTPVRPNEKFEGKLESVITENYYSFRVDTSGFFTIDFKPLDVTANTGGGWKIELYDGVTGDALYTTFAKTAMTSPEFDFKKGTALYLKISAGGVIAPVGQKYSVRIHTANSTHWEQEKNDTVNTANALVGNQTYYGNLYSSTDVDYYKYTVAKDGYFNVCFRAADFTQNAGDGWNVTVYNARDNKELFSFNTSKATDYEYCNFKKGTKLLFKVSAGRQYNAPLYQKYSMKIREKASNYWEKENFVDSSVAWSKYRSSATKMVFKKNYAGNLYNAADTDLYKFNVAKNGYVTISFNPNDVASNLGGGYGVKIYDSNGKLIDLMAGVQNRSDKKYYFSKGTYYVEVAAGWKYNAPVNKTYKLSARYTAYTPKKVASVKASGTKVYWKRVSGATAYEVKYTTRSDLKGGKTVTTSGNSYKLTGLKKDKNYYVSVRPYKLTNTGKKVVGTWSRAVKVKAKK